MTGWTVQELAGILDAPDPGSDAAIRGVSKDTRTLAKGDVYFALKGENFDGNSFVDKAFEAGAAAAVTTCPVQAGPCIVVDDPLAALETFAARHRDRFTGPVFALTGSCGKTTAKEFTAALLSTKYRVVKTPGNLNNEIGCPLSLLGIEADTGMAVIEMGANHAGEIARLCRTARPTESAITMIAPAHLEGFGSVEDVAAAKSEIMTSLPPDGFFYVNTDDPRCAAIGERFSGETIGFGSRGEVRLLGWSREASGDLLLEIAPAGRLRLPLPVRAHVTNVLLAVAVGLRHGVTEFEAPLRRACAASTRFRVVDAGPLEVLDDTYNANPASMAAALEALADRGGQGRRLAALGEMLELGEAAPELHRDAGRKAGACGVDRLYARGPHACDMIQGAREAGVAHAERIEDHAAMAAAILDSAAPGDRLLLKGSRGMRMELVLDHLRRLLNGKSE
jgi:UDP-N-acetylmuramoyl-tripeptide--D-alanyl-D-alanine ligase